MNAWEVVAFYFVKHLFNYGFFYKKLFVHWRIFSVRFENANKSEIKN